MDARPDRISVTVLTRYLGADKTALHNRILSACARSKTPRMCMTSIAATTRRTGITPTRLRCTTPAFSRYR